jgi:DNA-directed RNA polymerase subunit H (RpoH/RPB5)
MELLNAEVLHKSFGNGIITKVEDIYIYVLFDKSEIGEKKFLYPDIFKIFMIAKDPAVDEKIKLDTQKNEEILKNKSIKQEPLPQQQSSTVNKKPKRKIIAEYNTLSPDAEYIDVEDNIAFQYIHDICNLFGHNYNGWQKGACKHKYIHNVDLWFPTLNGDGEWVNEITGDGLTIYESSNDSTRHRRGMIDWLATERPIRYVFAKLGYDNSKINMYRFLGEYTLNHEKSLELNKAVRERTNTKIKLYRKATTARTVSNLATDINHSFDNIPMIDEIRERCIIIKITQGSIDRNNGSIYDTTRKHWKISIDRASTADYVLSVHNQVVVDVFSNMVWEVYTGDDEGRILFEGIQASEEIRSKYVGKRIPEKYRRFGNASPCQYVNC